MDNEIQYFWDQFNKGESTVSFLFRSARRGVYPTPPVQAECMYEAEIFGRSTGLLYTIE
jgi:alpha-2-macroglobulin